MKVFLPHCEMTNLERRLKPWSRNICRSVILRFEKFFGFSSMFFK
jgi:hypothetical protein